MRFLPQIPSDPVARIRLLSLWFALFATGGHMLDLALWSTAPATARGVGFIACLILLGWFVVGHRRQRFPEFATPFEAGLLLTVGVASSLPMRAMGMFFACCQLRSLYVSRREFVLLAASYGVARVLSIAFAVVPSPYSALSLTVALQVVGLIIISATFALLVSSLARQADAERSLQRSEARYRVLAAATHDMVYEWNVATDTVEHTAAIRTVFGFPSSDVVRDRFWWLSRIHPDDRPAYDAAMTGVLGAPTGEVRSVRYRVRRADGNEAVVVETAVVQRDATNSPVRVIGSVRDVTAEHRLEEQLRDVQKMEAVGQLAGGVAHDFNNLLTVIGGHVFMLEQGNAVAAPATRHLEGITRAAERAGAMTRQLLAFGRKQVLKSVVLDLNTVVIDVERLIGPLVGERVKVVTRLDPSLAHVLADAGQIEQVLINLAINARDAMPEGGVLTIATSNAADRVHLTVTDTGQGMTSETLSHLFEPFYTTKVVGRGTGLGLATAYGIIKQSKGDITVESAPAAGSTFTISLPITHQPAPEAIPAVTHRLSDPRGNSRRLLLVEDNDDVRGFARDVLISAGFQVLPARHGLDGLDVARAHEYAIDGVVTDVVMPEMGGRQMVEQLRKIRPDLPVLYISGYADDAVARREVGSGDDTLLEKPFSARRLRDAVNAMAGV